MVPFQSFGGTQYVVYILEETNGSLVTLTGSAEPFVTQEDDDADIFTPIRTQTGYLRVLDETADGNLMEQLMPSNNTQKLVQLFTGTWNNDFTTFTDGTLKWQGFLCAEAFTQPWDKQKKVIEFPVKGMLSVLKDVQIPESEVSSEKKIASIFVSAFNAIKVTPSYIYYGTDLSEPTKHLLTMRVQSPLFFDEEDINNEGDSYVQMVGYSYYDIISSIINLYGFIVREEGDTIIIAKYDEAGRGENIIYRYPWSAIVNISNGFIYNPDSMGFYDSLNMLSTVVFKGTDNQMTFVQGGKDAKVLLDISSKNALHMSLPQTTETGDAPIEVDDIIRGRVFVQPHDPRSNSIETYSFYEYKTAGYQPNPDNPRYIYVGTSTYYNCLHNSVIYRPLYEPHYSADDHLHTGAFPCRWYYQKDANSSPALVNGMFLNQMYLEANVQEPNYCYSIKTALSYKLSDGYLNIDMICNNFMRGFIGDDRDKLFYGEYTSIITATKPQTKLYCILTWGTKEWDGSAWVDHSGNYNYFEIEFDGAGIKTNKTDDMLIDGNTGWFIPVTEQREGVITLYITNVSKCEQGGGYRDNHSKIIANLKVEFIHNNDIAISQRTKNTYRQTIMQQGGFSESKEINLTVGTMNNNFVSCSFLKINDEDFAENFTYNEGNTTYQQRPELNLLARMVAHYNQVRRTFKGIVASGLDITLARYTYLGRKFFGVDARHNWRDDTQEVKFIEIT